MRKTIRDMLDIYALKHKSDNIYLMLQDYVLDERLNRDELNEMVILELGERITYWQHTDLLKVNIENWFATHEDNIKKLVDTLELEYNPLYNTDYYEKVDDKTKTDNKKKTDNKIKTDNKRTEDLDTHVKPDDTIITENQVSAYDASGYQPQDYSTQHNTGDNQTKGDNVITDDDLRVDDNLTVDDNLEVKDNLKHHYGKEGTETYADLINEERRLAEFNIYDWIVNQLDSEICLGVF